MARYGIAVCALVISFAHSACAHPHAWIDVKSRAVVDAQGNITAIKEQWVFDEYYTEFVLQDFAPKDRGAPSPDTLRQLAHTNLGNLKDYSYFTFAESAGVRAVFSEVREVESHREGKRIAMNFTLALAEPANAKAHVFTYRIFDPSYYIEMLHGRKSDAALEGEGAANCRAALAQADPGLEEIALAQALDKKATAPASLGSAFAQTVSVSCP